MEIIIGWIYAHQSILSWLTVFSVLTFLGTLLVIPILIIHIPEEYFLHEKRNPAVSRKNHPGLRFLLLIVKNILGAIFVIAGIAMLVLPGQGLLTILIGVMLMSFPGKYALKRKIIMQKQIFKTINRLRVKANRPPIRVELEGEGED